jgi:aminoglycoside 6'-N-acetyltransferase I
MIVRSLDARDRTALMSMRTALWPDLSNEENVAEVEALLAGHPPSTMALAVLVAEDDRGALAGFVEVGLRSHADGCDARRPVGFVEGWFVVPEARRRGVGRALMAAAEGWARGHGCREMGSDTWLAAVDSQRAHEALGFEVVDRCVNYRKAL